VSVGRAPEVPPDSRPIGSLLLGDPSGTPFTAAIHRWEPVNPPPKDEIDYPPHGIRSVDKRMLRYHDPKSPARREDEE
jgi:hypothetical protein